MTKKPTVFVAAGAAMAGIGIAIVAMLGSRHAPEPVSAPTHVLGLASVPAAAPSVGAVAVLPADLVTLPSGTAAFGYVWVGKLPVQQSIPAQIAAAVAASPQHLARLKGASTTVWAAPDKNGNTQCWTATEGLVYCRLLSWPTTLAWHPVVIK